MTQTHQLAAIMFVDIVGYTALMGSNEKKAFEVLDQFKQISRPLVEENAGRWLKELGDGVLCSFGSTVDAVNGAISIQQVFNNGMPNKLRIGIHSGDVIFKDGDVLGDGVNVAFRIQNEAAPGGICISDSVYKTIRNKEEIKTTLLGNKSLKNVPGQIRLYQVTNQGIDVKRSAPGPAIALWKVSLIGLSLVLLTALSMWYLYRFDEPKLKGVERYDIILPDQYPLAFIGSAHFGVGQTSLTISPDGSVLIYAGETQNTTKLFQRQVANYEVIEMEGTEGAYFPFFSKSGKWVGFFSNGYLKKIPVMGGQPIQLCQVTNPSGAVWTNDNRIIFGNNEGASLFWVPAEGGNIEALFPEQADYKFGSYEFPSMAGNRYVLVSSEVPGGIYAISLEDGQSIKIVDYGYNPSYLSSGHISFVDYGRLMVAPFDLDRMQITGDIIPAIGDLRTEENSGQVAISNQGDLIYAAGISAMKSEPVFLSKDSFEETAVLDAGYHGQMKISPDGTALMIRKQDDRYIYIYELESLTVSRLPSNSLYSAWGPGQQQVTYNSSGNIYRINLTGTEEPVPILKGVGLGPYGWSPDSKVLMYADTDSINEIDIKFHVVNKEEDFVLMPNKGNQMLASFSPDGKYVAYTTDISGQSEVYVQPFPPNGKRWVVSSNGGEEPIWAPDKQAIYYRKSQDWHEVEFSIENGFSVEGRNKLFTGPYLNVPGYSYHITPDGQYFILLKPVSNIQTSTKLKVVKNWFEEIKAIAPVNK